MAQETNTMFNLERESLIILTFFSGDRRERDGLNCIKSDVKERNYESDLRSTHNERQPRIHIIKTACQAANVDTGHRLVLGTIPVTLPGGAKQGMFPSSGPSNPPATRGVWESGKTEHHERL